MGLISNGTTIFDAGTVSGGGSLTFIKKLTASGSANLTFHHGTSNVILDSTYKEYIFTFKNIHPSSNTTDFSFQANTVGASGFNESITSTFFNAYNNEADSARAGPRFLDTGVTSQHNETGFNLISVSEMGNDNDQCLGGYLHLFNPSSTTFVKHFLINVNQTVRDDYTFHNQIAGYFNVTAAIDEIQFKMAAGNIDLGDICLYGVG
jgi:hypothetical protein